MLEIFVFPKQHLYYFAITLIRYFSDVAHKINQSLQIECLSKTADFMNWKNL